MKILNTSESSSELYKLKKEEARIKKITFGLLKEWCDALENGDWEEAKTIEKEEEWYAEQIRIIRKEFEIIIIALEQEGNNA